MDNRIETKPVLSLYLTVINRIMLYYINLNFITGQLPTEYDSHMPYSVSMLFLDFNKHVLETTVIGPFK